MSKRQFGGRNQLLLDTNAIPSQAMKALKRSFKQVSELAKLEQDWDGEGSEAPGARVVECAERLLIELCQRFGQQAGDSIRPSVVAPIPGGGIYLEWRSPLAEFQVDVLPDGKLGYLFVDRSGEKPRFEEGEEEVLQATLHYIPRVLAMER